MKKSLFAGLIILLPIVLTIIIVVFLFDFFTTPFVYPVTRLLVFVEIHLSILIPYGINIFLARLIALTFLFIFILLLGMFARAIIVRHFIRGMHQLLSRIPVVKTVFQVSRDLFSALFGEEKKTFKHPVMIPFPSPPNQVIGFLIGSVPSECQRKVNTSLSAVFMPTAPHPISGTLFLVEQQYIKSLDMTNEDALKFLVSCGMITPKKHDTP